MKPDDLDDLDPVEPDAMLLARVRARGASLRRRRRVQRFGSVVVAVAVLALAGGVALAVGGTNHANVSAPTASSTTTATTVPTEDVARAIIGEWRPVSIAAYQGPLTSPPLNSPSVLRFTAATKWEGSDGCNGQDGTYALDHRGSLHFALHISTTMACRAQTPTPQSLEAATRVEIRDDTLMFFDRADRELAQFERAADKSVAGLKAAALAWSNAFLTGTSADIFAMEGSECRPTTSTTLSESTISAYLAGEHATMKQHFGMPLDAITAHGVSVRNFTGTTGEALVLYDLPESKTGNDNWVSYAVEGGAWKVADCHAPIGGSSTSAASSAP